MPDDAVDPQSCLLALAAGALRVARAGAPLLVSSLGIQAVANAFVMLGLLPETEAEQILAGHRSALEAEGCGDTWGVSKGELTVRPGAHGYWDARVAGPAGLREIPLALAPAAVHCPASPVDVLFEQVKLTPAGLRLGFRAERELAGEAAEPLAPIAAALSQISLADDAGRRYTLAPPNAGWSRTATREEWHGETTAVPDPPATISWLQFSPTAPGDPGRVLLPPPAQLPAGPAEPPWPSPAECYLAYLARVTRMSINGADLGREGTAEVITTVADSLLAAGALPPGSTLLRHPPATSEPAWLSGLRQRWSRRACQQARLRGTARRGLAARLPLENATAVIEAVSVAGELVTVDLYGHPWVTGEYWPMITPCFGVRAVDEAGGEHEGHPGGWQGSPACEGSGSFWLWPPVPAGTGKLRVIVSTLWEAAWADIALPAAGG